MRLGILGGGQLGRMLALAGIPLGVRCRVLEPDADAPASAVADHVRGEFDDTTILDRFAMNQDVITYEIENVPISAAQRLAAQRPVYPPPRALEVSQERLAEKQFFERLGVSTPPFAPVESSAELESALRHVGMPAIVKTRRFGYDGKGQAIVRHHHEIDQTWRQLGEQPLLVEGFVSFARELSVIAVRSSNGEVVVYPVIQNTHRGGILRLSIAPAPDVSELLQNRAERIARKTLESLDYVGVLAIELFEVDGNLLVNEMAPRVHNSGHWTIEGATTSQFENHVRAVFGLPLGDPSPRGVSAMVNLIGDLPHIPGVLRVPGTHLHLYGKQPRAGRKIGHITVCAEDRSALRERLSMLTSETGIEI